MSSKSNLNRTLSIMLAFILTGLTTIALGHTRSSMAFDSPPPGVFASPLPTPTGSPRPSQAALAAREFIASQKGIPTEALDIVVDHPTEYPNLGRRFQVTTLLDVRPHGEVFKLLVDLQSGRMEENLSALLAAEARAYEAQHGKLHPALEKRLAMLSNEDTLPVAIWVAPGPQQSLTEQQSAAFATLAAKYPEARSAIERTGMPMDVTDLKLQQQIMQEYDALLATGIEVRLQPVITKVQSWGFKISTYPGMPSFAVVLPKRLILDLAQRSDVGAMYLIEAKEQPALDSAIPTSLAPIVWGRGYDGTAKTIAILEHGNVDWDNVYLHPAGSRLLADNGEQQHTTLVASCAASFHDTFRGVAPGATILSAGSNGEQLSTALALGWALEHTPDKQTDVVNFSAVFETDNDLNWTDRVFDYWVRAKSAPITVAAGNSGGSIGSPGKGWNVITVGAFGDQDTVDWSDDQMASFSAYVNPVSLQGDREKPEIVAVGTGLKAVGTDNLIIPGPVAGTSYAAPQVAGLAALLIHRNLGLVVWPQAIKTIIMTSATHNITGPTTIVRGQGDLRDGAGGINAALADTLAQAGTDFTTTCYTSCWSPRYISNSWFPVGTDREKAFYANQGDLIRVAIAWYSNPDTPDSNYSFDRLDTDLDLRIKYSDGQYVSGVNSLSYDNNYEILEFIAPRSDYYKAIIRKQRADEPSNYMAIAFVRLRRTLLPLVMK